MKNLKREQQTHYKLLLEYSKTEDMVYWLNAIDQIEKDKAEIRKGNHISLDELGKEIETW